MMALPCLLQGSLSEFRGNLIRDKLEAKAGEMAKVKLSQSVEALEKQSKLTSSDVTVRAMAKVMIYMMTLARWFHT